MTHSATAVLPAIVMAVLWSLPAIAAPDAAGLLDPIAEKPEAPGFELKGADGKTYRLADMRGQPVIVNFWATWCPPCRAEMPAMQRAWEQLKDEGIMLVAVNAGDSEGEIAAFVEHMQVSFPLPMDTNMQVTQSWPLKGLPTTFVVDPQGRLVYRAQGEREWDDAALLDLVRALRRQ
ncbi:MAG: TlpA family protein disulfide reductase [Thiohalocapsa sp.]|uniref:peroxiredoxin family protein n=1 Tax=Thiohalocapsa sp. TaxID=2497641 RepID=UPI0025DB78B3|nr:TlpA disulfide reductase family protein [Thiohalocapsa sp.]MCG6940848.1 TlpA family protein disulfide reductase [Thiohalocapsa sp.]